MAREYDNNLKHTSESMQIYEIFKLLNEGDHTVDFARAEDYLDQIAFNGISRTAEIAWDSISMDEIRPSADPSEVREYLRWIKTVPPIRINDIGAVDEIFVQEANLTEDYIEELREILEFADPSNKDISVLDIPSLRNQMRDYRVERYKKYLTLLILDIHGIAHIFDREDSKEWGKLRKFAEELSSEVFRLYSRYLRERVEKKLEKLPLRDVVEAMDDILTKQRREIELATGNVNASDLDKRRLLETMPEGMRNRILQYIEKAEETIKTTESGELGLGEDELRELQEE